MGLSFSPKSSSDNGLSDIPMATVILTANTKKIIHKNRGNYAFLTFFVVIDRQYEFINF